jgi:hypothetical protein
VFQCTEHIWARITPRPSTSLYILDFVDNNGSRIKKHTGLVVFAQGDLERFAMEPWGRGECTPDLEIELYNLSPAWRYEIRLRETQQLLRSISFTSQVTVQCTQP